MNWLMKLINPFKSQLFALAGVVAVCGLATSLFSYVLIQEKNKRIEVTDKRVEDMTGSLENLTAATNKLIEVNKLAQEDTETLQGQLATLDKRSADAAEQLEEIGKTNDQVKEYLSRPIPADLRRVLDKQ